MSIVVPQFKGDLYGGLWASMGDQQLPNGTERHGQACFLWTYPQGEPSVVAIADFFKTVGDIGTSLEIDNVIAAMHESITMPYMEPDAKDKNEYDGFRAGAGWLYASLIIAKGRGCTQASAVIASNDGNMAVNAWDDSAQVAVYAVHHCYYGT